MNWRFGQLSRSEGMHALLNEQSKLQDKIDTADS